jgi:hypothetical protein
VKTLAGERAQAGNIWLQNRKKVRKHWLEEGETGDKIFAGE